MENHELLSQILNPSCSVINASQNNSAIRMIKTQYNEQTDFIYLFRRYGSEHPLAIGERPDYAGFVSYKTNRVYPGHYQLRELLKDAPKAAAARLKMSHFAIPFRTPSIIC